MTKIYNLVGTGLIFHVESRKNSKKNHLTRFSGKIGHFLVFKAVKFDEKLKFFVKILYRVY